MHTLIKLGGSIITDKRGQEQADLLAIGRLAREINVGWHSHPQSQLIIGHGSGSFGHVYAARYGVHRGIPPGGNWMGYALTARAAVRLNRIVVDALLAAGLPALALQPSASLQSTQGQITSWDIRPIENALTHGLVPVVHGDVAFDTAQGSAIISTEALFAHLVDHLTIQPRRLLLVGETAIHTADPFVQPHAERVAVVTPANIDDVLTMTGGARGTDVTGGMHSKLRLMWQLVRQHPHLTIHILGAEPGALQQALRDPHADIGTRITATN